MILIAALSLTGCASVADAPIIGETSSSPASDSEPATLDFSAVAIQSCDRAFAEGVEESVTGGSYRQVMVPKESAVDGYSAAWEDTETGEVGLIWEADAFLSCAAAITIGLAQEAGEVPNWTVTNTATGFELFQDFGEYGTQTIRFSVTDKYLSSAAIVGGEIFEIRYGPDLGDGLNLILAAIDQFGE